MVVPLRCGTKRKVALSLSFGYHLCGSRSRQLIRPLPASKIRGSISRPNPPARGTMTMRLKHIFLAALAMAVVLLPGSLRAQQQQSVADAARKAQAEKKESPKAVRVFTNDDIESVKGTISVVGA